MRITSAVVGLAAILAALFTASSAAAAATLAGEQLRSGDHVVASAFSCNASGARIVFHASGDAVAPSMTEDFVRSTARVTYDDVGAAARRYSTDAGVAASLCTQLAAAKASALRGANDVKQRRLSAAASLVGAQRGKSLTSTQADELLALIARL